MSGSLSHHQLQAPTERNTYKRTERTHEENQERAYIAASRRSDRSLEARLESARRASEIHKRRTGKGLRVTEADVQNEEMYEEEDDLPSGYGLAGLHGLGYGVGLDGVVGLAGSGTDYDMRWRMQMHLERELAIRSALFSAQHSQAFIGNLGPGTDLQDPYTSFSHLNGGQNVPDAGLQRSQRHSQIGSTIPTILSATSPKSPAQSLSFFHSPISVRSGPYNALHSSRAGRASSTNTTVSSSPAIAHRRAPSNATPSSVVPQPLTNDSSEPHEQGQHAQYLSVDKYFSPLAMRSFPQNLNINPFTTTLPVNSQQLFAPGIVDPMSLGLGGFPTISGEKLISNSSIPPDLNQVSLEESNSKGWDCHLDESIGLKHGELFGSVLGEESGWEDYLNDFGGGSGGIGWFESEILDTSGRDQAYVEQI